MLERIERLWETIQEPVKYLWRRALIRRELKQYSDRLISANTVSGKEALTAHLVRLELESDIGLRCASVQTVVDMARKVPGLLDEVDIAPNELRVIAFAEVVSICRRWPSPRNRKKCGQLLVLAQKLRDQFSTS